VAIGQNPHSGILEESQILAFPFDLTPLDRHASKPLVLLLSDHNP
jgi:hypothetical protein